MSFRKKLQVLIIGLTCTGLGLAAVTLWATLQWQRSEKRLQNHYLRSLLLQEVRAATFRAFKEVPDAASGGDPDAPAEFEQLLKEAEKDFLAWAKLADTEAEGEQVRQVRTTYDALTKDARHFFELVATGRTGEAYHIMEKQLENVYFEAFDKLSAQAVESDEQQRRLIQAQTKRARELEQVALGVASVATVTLVGMLAFSFVSGLFRPLREVEKALGALGRGDLQRRIPETAALRPASMRAEDELSTLVHAFNRTVDELSRTTVSKSYVDSIIESMADALVVAGADGAIRTANPAAAALFCTTREEMLGRPLIEFFLPDDGAEARDRIRNVEKTIRTRTGREITVMLSRSMMRDSESRVEGIVCVAQDISERKRAEQLVRAALEEKKVLFKEIHHRVKNNLQVVSSLLNLQARQIADPEGLEALKESQNRIQAMALIHDELYSSETPARIDFGDYVSSLTAHLLDSYGAGAEPIRLTSDIARISLSLDTAIPCGLIINELVTNSLKHAFAGRHAGEIRVELREQPNGHHALSVYDDGAGLPPGLRIEETGSLGLRLVRTLTEQLGGKLVVSSNGGARFEIVFPAQLAV
jgi:PAS domain S-box-containing protein